MTTLVLSQWKSCKVSTDTSHWLQLNKSISAQKQPSLLMTTLVLSQWKSCKVSTDGSHWLKVTRKRQLFCTTRSAGSCWIDVVIKQWQIWILNSSCSHWLTMPSQMISRAGHATIFITSRQQQRDNVIELLWHEQVPKNAKVSCLNGVATTSTE